MNEFTLNIMPIISFIQNALMILGGFTLTGIIIFLVYSHKNINVFINQNNRLIDKFPLVTETFMMKKEKLQNIENNQEIHEIKKELEEDIKTRLTKLEVLTGATRN